MMAPVRTDTCPPKEMSRVTLSVRRPLVASSLADLGVEMDNLEDAPTFGKMIGRELKRAGAEWKACCPFHSEKTASFTIYGGGSRFMCFGCGAKGDVFDFVSLLHGVGLRDAAVMLSQGAIVTTQIAPLSPATNASDRIDEARGVWRAALPAIGTPVEAYLQWRGISIQIPQTIRFARLRYGKTGREFPCLVAAVTSPDNKLCGIQRTYLAEDGRGKADVPRPKLSLGRVSCGAIRLAPVSDKLVVTEGLEDGLSLMEVLGLSVWVACGATRPNLARCRLNLLLLPLPSWTITRSRWQSGSMATLACRPSSATVPFWRDISESTGCGGSICET